MKKHVLVPIDRYQALLRKNTDPIPLTTHSLESEESPTIIADDRVTTPSTLSVEDITAMIPKNARHKAASLLQLLDAHVKWNSRGEIVIDGKVIENSHIADLIKFTVTNHFSKMRAPIGHHTFYKLLDKINIPRSLLVNVAKGRVAPHWEAL